MITEEETTNEMDRDIALDHAYDYCVVMAGTD